MFYEFAEMLISFVDLFQFGSESSFRFRYKFLHNLRDVCSSLVAHLAAVAVTWVQIPASSQIL